MAIFIPTGLNSGIVMKKELGKLGLGGVTFGREINQQTAFALIDHAYENEIYSFDTAAVYGGGVSEEIIGQWLTKNPSKAKRIHVATKIVPPFDSKTIIANVEQSLLRLGVDRIDVLYFHRWDDQLNHPESWLALEQLMFEGKIKTVGVSNFNIAQLETAINLLQIITPLRISYIQNNHNLAVSEVSTGLVKCCQTNAIKIITFSPLGAGFLTGKHLLGVASGSRFELMPGHQSIYFNDHAEKRLIKLLEVAKKTGYDPAYLALAWAIHQPQTDQVLVGGRSIAQLDLALAAAQFYDEEIFGKL